MTINKILAVDDSRVDLTNIQNIIAEAGYKVITATSGQEAIEKATAEHPDLIFMDINMPIMDGLKATKMIKDNLRNTKVVVLTMHGDQQEEAIQCGADGFIEKGSGAQKIKQFLSRFIMDE